MKLISWAAISKAGYISCEVTIHTKEVQTLYFFKQKLGRFKKRIFIRFIGGFGDGRFNINRINFQSSLGMGQKDEKILKNIATIWGGSSYCHKSRDGRVLWYSGMTKLELMISYSYIHLLRNPYKIAKSEGARALSGKKRIRAFCKISGER